jgi:hypothetical protein
VENLLKKHSNEVVSCKTRLKEIGRSSHKLLILKNPVVAFIFSGC